jgi:hypothetical protein
MKETYFEWLILSPLKGTTKYQVFQLLWDKGDDITLKIEYVNFCDKFFFLEGFKIKKKNLKKVIYFNFIHIKYTYFHNNLLFKFFKKVETLVIISHY